MIVQIGFRPITPVVWENNMCASEISVIVYVFVECLNVLAKLLCSIFQGDIENARLHYKLALKSDPSNAIVLDNLIKLDRIQEQNNKGQSKTTTKR